MNSNNIRDNVTFHNSAWNFKEFRCSFNALKNENKNGSKAGIRCHNAITAFFLRIFGKKIETIKTIDGKTIYLNKNSLKKWKNAHNFGDLPLSQIIQNVRKDKAKAAKETRGKAKEKAELATKNAETEEKREKLEGLNKEKAALEKALKEAGAEKDTERVNLEGLRAERATGESGFNTVISSFQDTLISENGERTLLEKSHEKLNTRLEAAKSAYKEAEQAVTDMEIVVNGTDKGKIQYLKDEIGKLRKEKSDFQVKLADFQAKLTKQKPAPQKGLKGFASAIRNLTHTDKMIKTLKDGIETSEKEIRKLTRLTTNRKQRNEFLTADQRVRELAKSEKKTQYDQLVEEEKKKWEELEKAVSFIEQQINVLLLKNAEKNSKLAKLDKAIRESESKIGKLSADIEAKEARLVEIKSSLPEAGKSLLNMLVGGDLEESESPVRGDDSKVDDANPEPVPAKELTAEEKIIAKNQEEVKKALADISTKVNQDVADIVQALTDKFKDDSSVKAKWACIDQSKGEYALQLNKPLRLWIRPSMDESTEDETIYDTKTPRGVVLSIGDNEQKEFRMRLQKDVIDFLDGFATYCEYDDPAAPGSLKKGTARGPLTQLSYDTDTDLATTHIEAVPEKVPGFLKGIIKKLGAKDEIKVKKTILRDWENGEVVGDDYVSFLSLKEALVDGILPSEQAS